MRGLELGVLVLLALLLGLVLADCSSGHSGGLGNVTVEVHRHYNQTPSNRDGGDGGGRAK